MMQMLKKIIALLIYPGTAAIFFGVSAYLSYKIVAADESVANSPIAANETPYNPQARVEAGEEIAFIYIGASSCQAANNPTFIEAVRGVKEMLVEKVAETGNSYTTVGIAVDLSTEAGLKHLSKFGQFDEIMTGRGWINEGVLKYVWQDHPGRAATPQVLIVRRTVRTEAGVEVNEESILIRKIGLASVQDWLNAGLPLPHVLPAETSIALTEQ
jgi:hypothetical protein